MGGVLKGLRVNTKLEVVAVLNNVEAKIKNWGGVVKMLEIWHAIVLIVFNPFVQVFPVTLNISDPATLLGSRGQNCVVVIRILPVDGIEWEGVIENLMVDKEFIVVTTDAVMPQAKSKYIYLMSQLLLSFHR